MTALVRNERRGRGEKEKEREERGGEKECKHTSTLSRHCRQIDFPQQLLILPGSPGYCQAFISGHKGHIAERVQENVRWSLA